MSLGQVIKQKRLEQGLSQDDLAIKVGVAKAMIGQVERGTKTISVPLCQEVAKALNCTINDLIEVG